MLQYKWKKKLHILCINGIKMLLVCVIGSKTKQCKIIKYKQNLLNVITYICTNQFEHNKKLRDMI